MPCATICADRDDEFPDEEDLIDRKRPGNAVESQDIHQEPESFLVQVIGKLSLGQCSSEGACHGPLCFGDKDVCDVAEPLVKDVLKGGKPRSLALQKLYQMTDRDRKYNRVPLVCTDRFDLVVTLIHCVTREAPQADRRRALLLLSNLAIPTENKAAILLSPRLHQVIPALLKIIRSRLVESYLAAACLFNLSYLDDAKKMVLTYITDSDSVALTYAHYEPHDDPNSLVRIIEGVLEDFVPYLEPDDDQPSVETETTRWCMGLMRNLVTQADCALIVGTKTAIPTFAGDCLFHSSKELHYWTRDSLEDACLMLLVHLAQYDECLCTMRKTLHNGKEALERLAGQGGIHEMRASAVLARLDGQSSDSYENDEKKDFGQSYGFGSAVGLVA